MPSAQPVLHTIQPGENLYTIAQQYQTSIPAILSQNDHLHPSQMIPGVAIQVLPGAAEHARRGYCPEPSTAPSPKATASCPPVTLHDEMRLLWEQHIYWTRLTLISIAHRLPDQTVTARRLLETAADLAALFGRYYPGAKANIQRLLEEHIEIAGNYITALRDGNTARAQALQVAWYQNADRLAELLHTTNPSYRLEETRRMLYKHLALIAKEIKHRIEGDYAQDTADADEVEQETMLMADYFSEGLGHRSARYP